jgi:hypothetical protein
MESLFISEILYYFNILTDGYFRNVNMVSAYFIYIIVVYVVNLQRAFTKLNTGYTFQDIHNCNYVKFQASISYLTLYKMCQVIIGLCMQFVRLMPSVNCQIASIN